MLYRSCRWRIEIKYKPFLNSCDWSFPSDMGNLPDNSSKRVVFNVYLCLNIYMLSESFTIYTWPPAANSSFPVPGCMTIHSSFSQEGTRLSFICTLWHKKEEAEGVILFFCKDKSGDCSPENSLEQLRLKRDPGTDGINETSSQLVFTIDQAMPSDSGTYQCCARSQKPDIRLQGRFFSVSVTGELLMSLIPLGVT